MFIGKFRMPLVDLLTALFLCYILAFAEASTDSPRISVYGDVPGLSPSPYYNFRVREKGSKGWLSTFALMTECSLEKFCNTTGFYDQLANWSNTYINFEMQDGVNIEIEITKLFGEPLQKAVVHPHTAGVI